MIKYEWLRENSISNINLEEYIDFAKSLGATFIQFKPKETFYYRTVNDRYELISKDEIEAKSIMGWLDRRLSWANKYTLPLYVAAFKKLWYNQFGTLDNIPQDYKNKVTKLYEKLRGGKKSDN